MKIGNRIKEKKNTKSVNRQKVESVKNKQREKEMEVIKTVLFET